MNFYLTALCVTLICVLIIDIFKFWDEFSTHITGWLTGGKLYKSIPSKILTCEVCLSHWANVIVMLVMGCCTIPNYLYILLLSMFTGVFASLLMLIESLLMRLINWLDDVLK